MLEQKKMPIKNEQFRTIIKKHDLKQNWNYDHNIRNKKEIHSSFCDKVRFTCFFFIYLLVVSVISQFSRRSKSTKTLQYSLSVKPTFLDFEKLKPRVLWNESLLRLAFRTMPDGSFKNYLNLNFLILI